MLKLLSIIKKNIQLLIRSKGSASIIVLGPLLVILLVGLGFNTSNAYRINIAVYSSSYSELADSLVDKLKADQFTVEKTASQDDCINSVKNGANHICMVIPADLDINAKDSKAIAYYVDYSRINLVYALLDSISTEVETKSSEISLQLTQSLLDIVAKTESELVARQSTLSAITVNNNLISSRLSNINIYLSNLSSDVANRNIGSSINNITRLVSSSNLSSKNKEYIEDSLAIIEAELSSKLTQIEAAKTNVNNEISGINEILGKSSQDIITIDKSVSSISEKISTIGIKSAEKIVSPISTEIKPITAEKSYLNFTFPTLLVLILSFVSIILASTLVIGERTSNAFFRNSITPTRDILFIFANYLTPLIVIFIQLFTILIIATIFFKGSFLVNLPFILLIIFISSSLFILLGMLIGNLFKSEETATIASISFLSLLIFFSNIIMPIESLPSLIKIFANLNPIVVSETILKRVILFNSGFSNVYKGLIILLAYIFIVAILLFMQYHFVKQAYKLKKIIYRKNAKL